MLKVNQIQNFFFLGIGGIGMSALARYFKHLGKNVAGYDKVESPLTQKLQQEGIAIIYTNNENQITAPYTNAATTLVVYTPAIPNTNSLLQYFMANNFNLKKRAQVLGMATAPSFCFAVAGTHGKTTTTAILAHLLHFVGAPMTAFLGGIAANFKSNFWYTGSQNTVVEADEFDRSFLHLQPNVACITTTDADHLDIYQTSNALQQSFIDFIGKLKPYGKLIIHYGLPFNGITYGLDAKANYHAKNIQLKDGAYFFDLQTPKTIIKNITLHNPGKHNLLNAIAAFTMAVEAGYPAHRLVQALATFSGVQRRFTYQLKTKQTIFIDDYAHHPTEINVVHQAIREAHPNEEVTVIFQPHLYSRTRDFANAFAAALEQFDYIILLEIYPARELPIKGITSQWLLQKINNPNKKLLHKNELLQELQQYKTKVTVTLGAGDIALQVPKIKKMLAYAS